MKPHARGQGILGDDPPDQATTSSICPKHWLATARRWWLPGPSGRGRNHGTYRSEHRRDLPARHRSGTTASRCRSCAPVVIRHAGGRTTLRSVFRRKISLITSLAAVLNRPNPSVAISTHFDYGLPAHFDGANFFSERRLRRITLERNRIVAFQLDPGDCALRPIEWVIGGR